MRCYTRSGFNMLGYWDKPDETARTIVDDGWLRTGDAGYLDEDGYLFLHDRIKDMVVSGGENIYPAEVENVLLAIPGVADAAVIGVPDDKWGETVKAVVVAAPDAALDEDAIIALLPGAPGALQVPDVGRLHRRPPPEPLGKGAQARAARALLAAPRAPDPLTGADRASPYRGRRRRVPVPSTSTPS